MEFRFDDRFRTTQTISAEICHTEINAPVCVVSPRSANGVTMDALKAL